MVGQLLFFFLFIHSLYSIEIDARIESKKALPETPIRGLILIQHEKNEKIDDTSFKLEEKSLTVERVKEEPLNEKNLMTIYQFTLPPKSAGNYLLNTISVSINGSKYASIPSSYFLEEVSTLATDDNFTLQMTNLIEAPEKIYKGARFTLGYTYTFNVNLQLQEETLPFLHAKGLEKIGDKEIVETQEGAYTTFSVKQTYRALKEGALYFKGASISGYPYKEGQFSKTLLSAQTAPVTLEVLPFPEENRPSFFEGALGLFSLESTLNKHVLSLDEPFTLTLTYFSQDDYETLPLLDILCQPHMSGAFIEEKPPLVEKKKNKILVHYFLKAQTTLINQIPPLYFASFNPAEGAYVTMKTKEIPLEVTSYKNLFDKPLEKIVRMKLPQISSYATDLKEIKTAEELEKSLNRALISAKTSKEKAAILEALNEPALAMYYRNSLSLTHSLYLVSFLAILTLIAKLKRYNKLFYSLLLLFFLTALKQHYTTAPQAIVIRGSNFLKNPDPKAPLVRENILEKGAIVYIIGKPEQDFIKVRTENKTTGFVEYRNIFIL
jgi:hypothetical protein